MFYLVLVATLLAYGFRGKPKQVTFKPYLGGFPGNGHKITDWGKNFESSQKLMGIKPKWRWPHFGRGKLAHAQFHELYRKLACAQKKRLMAFQERDEVKRKAFIAHLSSVATAQIVYLDESPDRSAEISTIMVGMKEGSVSMHSNRGGVRVE